MKYIRTKDGIYERITVVRQLIKDYEVAVFNPNTANLEPIINQADTIEELCDEFIVVHENGNHVIQKKVGNGLKDMDKDYPKYLERNNQFFYGAIWTDKGLIYVAKMNDKGELELL